MLKCVVFYLFTVAYCIEELGPDYVIGNEEEGEKAAPDEPNVRNSRFINLLLQFSEHICL